MIRRAGDLIGEALAAVREDRRQAWLAMIGVVCGVAAVVAALAIAEGARREALAQVEAMGIDNVLIRSNAAPVARGAPRPAPLTLDEAGRIARGVGEDVIVAPMRSIHTQAETRTRAMPVTAFGVTTEWNRVRPVAVVQGRWLTSADVDQRRRAAVIGAAVAAQLGEAGDDPVGRLVRLGPDWYRVVGVLGGAAGDVVVVPLTALDVRQDAADPPDRIDEIVVKAGRPDQVSIVAARVRHLLHQAVPDSALEVVVPRELFAARLRARRLLDAVLVSVGALVLGTSGIGIMNVMLAGLGRRVMEIGVRRAVGARRSDVIVQFAAESVVLCGAGGAAGLPLGVALTAVAGRLAGWTTAVSLSGLVIAMAMAALVGLTAGIYPALVAARLTPCEALSHP